jgi:serine/threonine protein kinase
VYLATDRRLNRKVALKFLPASFLQDSERVRRFRHEALVASGLNHPNILTVHEIGEADGHEFIVTEFVDGETLRQKLSMGPLTIFEALQVTEQITSALAAAHAEGVVHRDIKPDNIMLRRDGIVKVLDFGLAKYCSVKESGPESATRAIFHTSPGIVLGTVNYMSPEQARGLPIDARTDLWSLGVVLYEMVTGRLPFTGKTNTDVIVSILERPVQPLNQSANAEVPRLQPILTRALTKDVNNRYQHAEEMCREVRALKEFFSSTSTTEAPTVMTPRAISSQQTQSAATIVELIGL